MRVLVPTDGESQDVFGGRESKAELSGVVTDDLEQSTQTASQTRRALRNPAAQRQVNTTAAFGVAGHARVGCWCAHLLVQQPQGVFDVGVL